MKIIHLTKMTNETQENSSNAAPRTQIVQASTMSEYNTNENWQLWHERLELHFLEIGCTTEQSKISTLLKTIGAEAYGILHSICSPTLPFKKTYDDLCAIMKQQFTPPVIIFHERKKFYAAKMNDSESVASWFARVKKLSLDCKFGDALEKITLDKFVVELPLKIFEKICEEDEKLSLNDAFKKALLRESKIAQGTNCEVNFIKPHGRPKSNNNSNANGNNNSKRTPCTHCGWKNHDSNSCKFRKSVCHSCKRIGHLANICKSKKTDKNINFVNFENNICDKFSNNFSNSVNSFQPCDETGNFDFSIYAIDSDYSMTRNRYELPLMVNGVRESAQCDTGAPCSLMSISTFDKHFDRRNIKPCNTPFTGYGGEPLKIIGEFQAIVNCNGQNKSGKFVITNSERPTLLGRDFLRAFGFELTQKNVT